ncbi:unnamed protein product [Taenia asiatica]|uniref:Uncharacterized protein n=1 Tax=Taenia asiatica TaxID=60517 RepID=A0A0R3VU48_TAEAS|nr:unnamed protein product [Taenia asiatica]
MRRRKDKQSDEKKTQKRSNSKNVDKLNTLPPTGPGSAMKSVDCKRFIASPVPNSIDITTSNNLYSSQSVGSRNVLFRDNRFPDGTVMPRIQTQQSRNSPVGGGREGRVSPTGSVHSLASTQPALFNYASYPPSYVPQNSMRPAGTTTEKRGRIRSDSVYQSVCAEPLPKPDYPLSNDGTKNSNQDSGLDTESRSSSGGKPVFGGTIDRCPRWKVSSCCQNVLQTPRCTSSLQRIQLEDGLTSEKINCGRSRRRFRKEDENLEYTVRSASRGLPRNQPIRGGYFEEKNEVDRYGRLPPVRRPISRASDSREACDFVNGENNEDALEWEEKAEVDDSEEETSDSQDDPYNSNYSRTRGGRSQMQPNFYRWNSTPSMANREIGVSRM